MLKRSTIAGVYEGVPERNADKRGSVTKIFERKIFENLGIDCAYNETLISYNACKGVIRGFHFQYPPYAQSKLIYCLSGACTGYLLDMRKGAPTYGQVQTIRLSQDIGNVLIVPVGVANAYFIEADDTTILYQLTAQYMPQYDGGVRWDSLGLDIAWPDPIVSEKDMRLPPWAEFNSPFVWEGNV